ncbi:uncharacterized protein JCM10292_004047 [Rhodotorula paludigena]|uniref:uncharacterized protein n=1 Tax=Rhodotorula paludigena TaxID=86838 RepID=UPI0031767C61
MALLPTSAQGLPTPARGPIASLSTLDKRTFAPSPDTVAWLYSLPLPPGCSSQPVPANPADWALVEQYRLLCQGLTVLGEYARERAKREEAGEDPFAREWDPRTCDNPAVLSAVESLFKDVFPSHPDALPATQQQQLDFNPASAAYAGVLSAVEASLGGSAAGELRVPAPPPKQPKRSGKSPAHAPPLPPPPALPSLHEHHSLPSTLPSGATLHAGSHPGELIASLPLSLSDLASSLPPHGLPPSQIPADGILSDLAASLPGGTASLPSLMSAIAELEQCVARLSLEASEARTLQKNLRDEMAARTGGGAASGGKKKKKNKKGKKKSGASAAVAAASAPVVSAQSTHVLDTASQEDDTESCCCPDCADPSAAPPALPAEQQQGLGVRAWEDGELMKALQSVSMLDRRADEYRERLRVLKEQIHHHAALADALASSPSASAGAPAGAPVSLHEMWPVHPDHEGVVYELEEEEEEEEELVEEEGEEDEHRIAPAGPYGTNASDTGLAWVSVDEHRQQLLLAEQARARAVAQALAQ